MGWVEDKIEEKLGALAATFTQESEKTRLAFAAALADTKRGLRIDGALPRTVQANALNYAAAGQLYGWSVFASAGPVRVTFHDGPDAGGDPIAILDLADQEHDNMWFGTPGVSFIYSLYLEATGTGAAGLTGAVHIGAVD